MRSSLPLRRRAGNIVVLTALLMVFLIGIVAFAVDFGYLQMVRTELQRTADAAAIASAWDLINEDMLDGTYNPATVTQLARSSAADYVWRNPAAGAPANLAVEDVVVGHLSKPSDPAEALNPNYAGVLNAVQVRVRRTASQNGEVPMFFSQVWGHQSLPEQAVATAAFLNNFSGFKMPGNGENLGILPFVLDQDTWNQLLQGNGTDLWTWDPVEHRPKPGPDGILEVNLYPQGTGSPGNRGTVNIGAGPGNSGGTQRLRRQILEGLSAEDLEPFGGELRLNDEGELSLPGDPGISGGMESALESIKGNPRMISIFTTVEGPGSNAVYTIVQFVGIRIMEVKLSGCMSSKRVIVQPAVVKVRGGIPSDGTVTSYYIHSPVWLVR